MPRLTPGGGLRNSSVSIWWRLPFGRGSERLQLAGKAALAAGIAWSVAPFIPGPAANYPYYAPFGALICMYPTVAGSAKQGLQSLVGLAVGVGLAFSLVSLGRPSPISVAVLIGV